MKRYRRMVSVNQIAKEFTKDNKEPSFRQALLNALPGQLFGPTVAAQIERVEVAGSVLRIQVPDDGWRGELEKSKKALLFKSREIHAPIAKVELVP